MRNNRIQLHPTRPMWLAISTLLIVPLASAQQPQADTASWQKFANATTIVWIKLDTASLGKPPWDRLERALTPATRERFSNWTRVHREKLQALRDAVGDQSIYAAIDVPYTAAQSPLRIYLPKGGSSMEKLLEPFRSLTGEQIQIVGDYVLITPGHQAKVDGTIFVLRFGGPQPEEKPYTQLLPTDHRPTLKDASAAVQGQSIQILVLPPEYLRTTFLDLLPSLPKELGGGPTRTLIDGAVWTAIGIDLESLAIDVTIQSASSEAAKAFAEYLPKMLHDLTDWARTNLEKSVAPHALTNGSAVLKGLVTEMIQPRVEGDRVFISMDARKMELAMGTAAKTIENLLGPLIQQATVDKFKQVVLAMHNYADAHKSFPPSESARLKDGKSTLSWRVHILPFIGENELYRQFHLDEPWDSEHNRRLLDKMPELYKPTSTFLDSELKQGHTVYLAPVGEGTIFGGDKPVSFGHITDGTSNTLLLVEVKPEWAVPWTAPQDYPFGPQNPATGLATGGDGYFVAAGADGAVHRLRGDLPAEKLLHLFQMNDGYRVEW